MYCKHSSTPTSTLALSQNTKYVIKKWIRRSLDPRKFFNDHTLKSKVSNRNLDEK